MRPRIVISDSDRKWHQTQNAAARPLGHVLVGRWWTTGLNTAALPSNVAAHSDLFLVTLAVPAARGELGNDELAPVAARLGNLTADRWTRRGTPVRIQALGVEVFPPQFQTLGGGRS